MRSMLGVAESAAVAAEVAVAEVVAEDHHDVGGAAGGGEGVGRGACGGDEFSSGDGHGAVSLGISYVLFEAVQGDFTVRLILLVVVMLQMGAVAVAQQKPAAGPLRVLKSNPRWFADPTGKAVLLTGSHVWQNLQDNGLLIRGAVSNPPQAFDYAGYLDFLNRHNHNFFRLWRWETTRWTDNYTGKEVKYARPHPWVRTGPGMAKDGEPKFDLTKFNDEYFKRMRSRVMAARDRGIYVSVMLFEGWEIQFSDAWVNHPFNGANNVNGVEGDLDGNGQGFEFNTLDSSAMGKTVQALQEAYVKKVIDTVNDLDNVLYEIANEAHAGSTEWQYWLIRFVKEYESRKAEAASGGDDFSVQGRDECDVGGESGGLDVAQPGRFERELPDAIRARAACRRWW